MALRVCEECGDGQRYAHYRSGEHYYCGACRPPGARRNESCSRCTKIGCYRVPAHPGVRYCKSCKPVTAIRWHRRCAGGCERGTNWTTPEGVKYCGTCRPTGATRPGNCACGRTGTYVHAGARYCRDCKPVEAVPHSRPCAGCGRMCAYHADPGGKRYCGTCYDELVAHVAASL